MAASLSAVVASAFIGAVATGLITLLVREIRQVLKTRRKRERFRSSLIGEIKSGTNNAGVSTVTGEAGGNMIPTEVYEAGTAKLGMLNEDEISKITSYYASARRLNALSERITQNPEEAVPDSERSGDTTLARAYYAERDNLMEAGEEASDKLRSYRSDPGFRSYLREKIPLINTEG